MPLAELLSKFTIKVFAHKTAIGDHWINVANVLGLLAPASAASTPNHHYLHKNVYIVCCCQKSVVSLLMVEIFTHSLN